MGIASLVLGIISLIIAVSAPYMGYLGLILGIVGIILGAQGKKQDAKCATGGMVCSIIGASLALAFWLACAACVAGVSNSLI